MDASGLIGARAIDVAEVEYTIVAAYALEQPGQVARLILLDDTGDLTVLGIDEVSVILNEGSPDSYQAQLLAFVLREAASWEQIADRIAPKFVAIL